MVAVNEGMTRTYNRFHTAEEQGTAIKRLRELHNEMDRAVLLSAMTGTILLERLHPQFLSPKPRTTTLTRIDIFGRRTSATLCCRVCSPSTPNAMPRRSPPASRPLRASSGSQTTMKMTDKIIST